MKRTLVSLAVLGTASLLNAGGFGGPPPFTNGSPLPTGVDGAYQANARGDNLTGVIRFAYSSGSQTSSTTQNSYAIFAGGLVYTGPVTASIAESRLAGTLDSQISSPFNIAASGGFSGKFDTNSPTYFFKGQGQIQTFVQDTTSGLYLFNFGQDFRFTGVRNSLTTD